MADTPDLTRIINLIMSNPSLVSEIANLASKDSAEEANADIGDAPEITEPVAAEPAPTSLRRSHRSQLLGAMKPYLSEGRAKAIDTMISIADILDMTRRG